MKCLHIFNSNCTMAFVFFPLLVFLTENKFQLTLHLHSFLFQLLNCNDVFNLAVFLFSILKLRQSSN